jgi:cytochrome P450
MSTNLTGPELDVGAEAATYLTDPSSRRDPWGFYRRLRQSSAVHHTSVGTWLVSGYEEANEVLRSDAVMSRREAGLAHCLQDDPEAKRISTSRMLYNDRPEHTRLRRLVSNAFTRRGVERWEKRVRQVAHERLDALEPLGRMDLVHDYSYPVVENIIVELLGIRHGDLPRFIAWSKAMTDAPPGADLDPYRVAANTATLEVAAYVRERIAERRERPQEDLLTKLIQAEDAEDGRLHEHELIAMTFELIFAGYETTSNLIGNGMLCLLQHPDQLRALMHDRTLLPGAIDEMLRFDSPVPMPMPRVTLEDFRVGGQLIPAGSTVVVLLAAANRDPSTFDNPDSFDIRRKDNAFISFGFGAHYCIGAQLARVESTGFFTALFDRLPGIRQEGEAVWSDHQFFRSLEKLPVAW